MGKMNGHGHWYWTCPECNTSYINSVYCYNCDILGDEIEAVEIERDDDSAEES